MLYVVAQCHVTGFHFWKYAPKEYGYLASRHRHNWLINAKKSVSDDDREIEVNDLQERIEKWLYATYGNPCEFDGMSCEQIAKRLLDEFELSSCEVLEDGYNGAILVKD